MERKGVRVLIADDHGIVRDGLRLLLSTQEQVEVVGEAGDGIRLQALLTQCPADLLLLDLNMPGLNRLQFIHELRQRHPRLKILVLTANTELATVRSVLDAGVHGYLSKGEDTGELLEALEALRNGHTYLARSLRFVLDGPHVRPSGEADLLAAVELTRRERQILTLAAQGRSAREIAEHFSISPLTVRKHRENLMRKLDLHSTAELAAYAVRLGVPSA
ncbi:response regulator transcription factor [Pseudomonas sp. ZM23]|uniref:Response regulator transcription factor n=1 Tax=Pseudomonas triclosanedens TaxID=2961893 RepID=A0ABY7A3Y8_9PSED|nr:response regulator transcription factor [Pseudomonas triclosanedens]MCP8464931.1 response regulator transcription factor [Pseudomonas triclosanedens]MCP8470357.1 response regulator transcription factor [Pseudomonas triclosanedens]MCP8476162.1 response regulator transcription factor [Pseudomonas triclosanedens]WAI51605.1 response regulator transcription factor [Pseudomonas triclosanedens]